MKKQFILLIMLFVALSAQAQLSTGETPVSFSIADLAQQQIKTLTLEKPNVEALLQEDESEERMFKPRRFGVILPVNIDFFAQAESTLTEQGTVYRLAVEVSEAQALIFYSSRFVLPKGGKFFLYNEDRSKVLGAFTDVNNHRLQTFATEYVEGEKLIMEYFEPKNVETRALIEVTEIGYAYRDIPEKSAEYRSSGSCNVNVNCSEGDNYRKAQRAVNRIQLKLNSSYIGWCTGALINNTNYDRTPYVLTAAHCIEDVASSSYYSQFVFYFCYETSGCSTPYTEPSRSKSLTGAELKAYDHTYNGGGSDFCLLLLDDQVPQSYNPFWCGWDRRNTAVSQGVCIHHPSGDVKKISTFTTPTQGVTFYQAVTHWQVYWSETANGYGITEGGSSGSPLLNTAGQIIGDLTGGSSDCYVSDDEKVDYYGKLSYSWTSNGTANNKRLKPWLDPANTGAMSIGGMDYTSSLPEVSAQESLASVAPNPANNMLNIAFDKTYQAIEVELYDCTGRKLASHGVPSASVNYQMDLQSLQNGVYIVKMRLDGVESSHKVIVQH